MKKLLTALSIFFAVTAAGASAEVEMSLEESSEMVSPCRYWTYDSDGRGYVCNSYALSMQVPDARDVDYKIRQLEQRVKKLESQLQELTNK